MTLDQHRRARLRERRLCAGCGREVVGYVLRCGPAVGDLVPAGILEGEETDGEPAGLGAQYRLRGVGLVRMRDVYPAEDLTDACSETDTCWAAVVTVSPSSDGVPCCSTECARVISEREERAK